MLSAGKGSIMLKIFVSLINASEKPTIFFFFLRRSCNKISHIFLDHFNQSFGDWSWMIHTRTHIDLNEPRIKIFIYHEIITYHFKETFFACHASLTSLYTPNYYVLYLLLNNLPFFRAYVLAKCFYIPHTFVNNCRFMVFLNWIVSKMHKFVVYVV